MLHAHSENWCQGLGLIGCFTLILHDMSNRVPDLGEKITFFMGLISCLAVVKIKKVMEDVTIHIMFCRTDQSF